MVKVDKLENFKNSISLSWNEKAALNSLDDIKDQLKRGQSLIHLKGLFKFTKTKKNYTEAILYRDSQLETDVQHWLESRASLNKVLDKYKYYDPSISAIEWPKHYPMRIIKGAGSICSSDNIFMFFPEVLGISTSQQEDYFGFEFVDVWSNVFTQSIFPSIRKTFDLQTQLRVSSQLRCSLDKTIFLASIFHELGHRVGPWKVSPEKDQNLKVSDFYLDIFGELSTDSLLISHLEEFPEIAQFVFFQRIFWFTRRGFRNNPLSALINEDNDAWIGALLWNEFMKMKLLNKINGKWSLKQDEIVSGFNSIIKEIDELGKALIQTDSLSQNQLVQNWMKSKVQFDENLGFLLPDALVEIFVQCQDIIEIPHFQPAIGSF
ncbi:MAG: hypothetical protein ACXVCP_01575 [Bdellovibrio sp.]